MAGSNPQVPVAYTPEQASALTGLSLRQLRRWSRDLYRPHYRSGLYSFRDLVALRTLAQLRNEHGIRPKKLRELGAWFAEHLEPEPWARIQFFTEGRELLWKDTKTGHWLSHNRPGQRADVVPLMKLARVERSVRAEARKLTVRTKDEIGRVTKERGIASGKPRIAGTRIRVDTIQQLYDDGMTVDEIIAEYPRLTAADVQAALKSSREGTAA